MESIIREKFVYSKPEESSILQKIKSSIDQVHYIRRKNSDSPKKLEIKMSSSYILKDKAIDFSNFSETASEVKSEKIINHKKKNSASKFTTKIQFVKPQQRKQEDSPPVIEGENIFFPERRQITEKEEVSYNEDQENMSFISCENMTNKGKNNSNQKEKEIIDKARKEIDDLKKNKIFLQEKITTLQESLKKIEIIDKEEVSTFNSIESKLQKLENQQINPEEDLRFPEAVSKLSNLEAEIIKLKSLKDSSVFQYEEQLKDVYLKLKDLQECNEILTEMVTCFHKEPIFSDRDLQNAETFTDDLKLEAIGTIKLAGLLNSESILQEAYEKKEQLQLIKTELENEYKSIPDDSKSMINKRRKLELEFELSMNYSQLVSINNKIKRYTST